MEPLFQSSSYNNFEFYINTERTVETQNSQSSSVLSYSEIAFTYSVHFNQLITCLHNMKHLEEKIYSDLHGPIRPSHHLTGSELISASLYNIHDQTSLARSLFNTPFSEPYIRTSANTQINMYPENFPLNPIRIPTPYPSLVSDNSTFERHLHTTPTHSPTNSSTSIRASNSTNNAQLRVGSLNTVTGQFSPTSSPTNSLLRLGTLNDISHENSSSSLISRRSPEHSPTNSNSPFNLSNTLNTPSPALRESAGFSIQPPPVTSADFRRNEGASFLTLNAVEGLSQAARHTTHNLHRREIPGISNSSSSSWSIGTTSTSSGNNETHSETELITNSEFFITSPQNVRIDGETQEEYENRRSEMNPNEEIQSPSINDISDALYLKNIAMNYVFNYVKACENARFLTRNLEVVAHELSCVPFSLDQIESIIAVLRRISFNSNDIHNTLKKVTEKTNSTINENLCLYLAKINVILSKAELARLDVLNRLKSSLIFI
jgi:hypothetical protein